jgi:protein-S-isoprenylcysteine O-methyltransferase Ste14
VAHWNGGDGAWIHTRSQTLLETGMSALGALLFVFLGLVRLVQAWQGRNVFALLLVFQAGLAAFRLVFRAQPAAQAVWPVQALAWLSACLPLVMETPLSNWLALASLPGLLLNLWALAALGAAFSIAPADRGLVRRGPYRLLRHPMYAGALLSLLPAVLGCPSARNLMVFGLFLASLVWRIRHEERLLGGYACYAETVRWRLLPGVW